MASSDNQLPFMAIWWPLLLFKSDEWSFNDRPSIFFADQALHTELLPPVWTQRLETSAESQELVDRFSIIRVFSVYVIKQACRHVSLSTTFAPPHSEIANTHKTSHFFRFQYWTFPESDGWPHCFPTIFAITLFPQELLPWEGIGKYFTRILTPPLWSKWHYRSIWLCTTPFTLANTETPWCSCFRNF